MLNKEQLKDLICDRFGHFGDLMIKSILAPCLLVQSLVLEC